MKWRPIVIIGLAVAAAASLVIWLQHARLVGHWLQVHTGTVNEPGPYYGFWSGFGSDLEEFGILGAIGVGIYHLVKKYNCHEPGCWRIGNHATADGQFNLCYRHHPDFQGKKPTHELIERLHREHLERQAAIRSKLDEIHERVTSMSAAPGTPAPGTPAPGTPAPGSPADNAQAASDRQAEYSAGRRHVTSPPTTHEPDPVRGPVGFEEVQQKAQPALNAAPDRHRTPRRVCR